MDDFPEVAARWMDERGMSVRALASAVHNDPSYVSRVLRGLKPAGPDVARRIDDALGAGGEIIAATSRPAPRPEPEEHVAPEFALYFASQLVGHYQADRFLGPGRLIPIAGDQYALLCEVAESASGPLRMLLGDMGDGRGVLDLTGAALRNRDRLLPKVQVLLLQQQAHGLALTGGHGAAAASLALLDEAALLLDAVDDDRPWGTQVRVPGYIDIQRATVCTRLGLAAEALALWGEVLPMTARGRNARPGRSRRAPPLLRGAALAG